MDLGQDYFGSEFDGQVTTAGKEGMATDVRGSWPDCTSA